jgi:hypothetical protein
LMSLTGWKVVGLFFEIDCLNPKNVMSSWEYDIRPMGILLGGMKFCLQTCFYWCCLWTSSSGSALSSQNPVLFSSLATITSLRRRAHSPPSRRQSPSSPLHLVGGDCFPDQPSPPRQSTSTAHVNPTYPQTRLCSGQHRDWPLCLSLAGFAFFRCLKRRKRTTPEHLRDSDMQQLGVGGRHRSIHQLGAVLADLVATVAYVRMVEVLELAVGVPVFMFWLLDAIKRMSIFKVLKVVCFPPNFWGLGAL